MKHSIRNSDISIVVNSLGAELSSITGSDGHEYLWQGSEESWTGQSPVLFPIVGSLEDGRYNWEGREYSMAAHGFARKTEWEFIAGKSGSDRMIFELRESDASRAQYPFPFRLQITYQLDGAGFTLSYEVENTGDGILPFSIGGHPAFNCPMDEGRLFSDYQLRFDVPEQTERFMKDEILSGEKEPFILPDGILPLNYETFSRCAVILRSIASRSVTLESAILKEGSRKRRVKVDFSGFADLGIWTHKNAKGPFVCIEPWFGVDSTAGNPEDRDFATKSGMIQLPAGQSFSASFSISISISNS